MRHFAEGQYALIMRHFAEGQYATLTCSYFFETVFTNGYVRGAHMTVQRVFVRQVEQVLQSLRAVATVWTLHGHVHEELVGKGSLWQCRIALHIHSGMQQHL